MRRGSSSSPPPRAPCLGPLLFSGPPGAPWVPQLKGLCTEPQWCSSFLGWVGLMLGGMGVLWLEVVGGMAGGLLLTLVPWDKADAAAAREAW